MDIDPILLVNFNERFRSESLVGSISLSSERVSSWSRTFRIEREIKNRIAGCEDIPLSK